jgi:hypothetical protein
VTLTQSGLEVRNLERNTTTKYADPLGFGFWITLSSPTDDLLPSIEITCDESFRLRRSPLLSSTYLFVSVYDRRPIAFTGTAWPDRSNVWLLVMQNVALDLILNVPRRIGLTMFLNAQGARINLPVSGAFVDYIGTYGVSGSIPIHFVSNVRPVTLYVQQFDTQSWSLHSDNGDLTVITGGFGTGSSWSGSITSSVKLVVRGFFPLIPITAVDNQGLGLLTTGMDARAFYYLVNRLVPLRDVTFSDQAIIIVNPASGPILVNSSQRFPGSRYNLVYTGDIADAYETPPAIVEPDVSEDWININAGGNETARTYNRRLLLCAEHLDCSKFEVIFKDLAPYTDPTPYVANGDPAEQICIPFNDYYGSNTTHGNFGADLTCVGVEFHRKALPKSVQLSYPTIGPSVDAYQLWQDKLYAGITDITVDASTSYYSGMSVNFDAAPVSNIDLTLKPPEVSGSGTLYLDSTAFTPGHFRSLTLDGSTDAQVELLRADLSPFKWPAKNIVINGPWTIANKHPERIVYAGIEQFTLPFSLFEDLADPIGTNVSSLTVNGINLAGMNHISFQATEAVITYKPAGADGVLTFTIPRPNSGSFLGLAFTGTVPLDGDYRRLYFDFGDLSADRYLSLPSGNEYLLFGLTDPHAARLDVTSTYVIPHLGNSDDNKDVYGNFTVRYLRFFVNTSASVPRFTKSVTFHGVVRTSGSFSYTTFGNWTDTTIFETLVANTALPEPGCSSAVSPEYCQTKAEAKKVTFNIGQQFSYDTRWRFGDVQLASVTATWEVRAFTPTHIRFRRDSGVTFYSYAPGPPPDPLPTVPPPPTISGEIDMSYLQDSGIDTLVRQHNGGYYSEFYVGKSGSLLVSFTIVGADKSVSFANCNEWLSRIRSGVRVVNVPAGFQTSLSFQCGNQTLSREGYSANWGPVENFVPEVAGYGIQAVVEVSGGNPYSPHFNWGSDDSGLSGGAIAGLVIGSIAFVAIIAVVVMVVLGVGCFGKGSDASA